MFFHPQGKLLDEAQLLIIHENYEECYIQSIYEKVHHEDLPEFYPGSSVHYTSNSIDNEQSVEIDSTKKA